MEVEVGGDGDEAGFVEGAVFAEGAVDDAAEAGGEGGWVEGSRLVALVEERNDFVAWFEESYAGPGGDDCAGAVGTGDDAIGYGEGVFAL